MTPTELQQLRDRVNRCRLAVEAKAHPGYTEAHVLSDGTTHTYLFSGIKSPIQLEDELLTLFVWIWSMKDHLKELCRAQGIDPKTIENIADSDPSLAVAADIANHAKHSGRRAGRSRKYPRLANVGIRVPQSAIASITVEAFSVGVDVAIPDQATIHASIEFESGEPPLDAFAVIEQAISAWENRAFPLVGV